MRLPAVVALSCLLVARVAPAGSGRCGDDVDGRGTAVPCDCGDVLVSDRTLGDTDPITHQACDGDGLLVLLPAGKGGAVLDLGNHILEGDHQCVGIRVLRAGDGGVTLKGPGAVRAFRIGIDASAGALGRISDVVAADNDADGFNVAGMGFTITNCEANHSGRDGFALRGCATTSRATGKPRAETLHESRRPARSRLRRHEPLHA